FLKQHNVPPALWHGDAAWPFERRLSDGEGGSERSLFTAADLRAVADARDALRAAVGAVGKPEWASTARPVRDLVRDFFDVMARLATRAKIEELIAEAVETHQVQDREEHEQVWARVSELADQLVDLLGEVEMTGSVFASTVQAQLAELELAIVPPTLDQVLVGTPDRTRVHTARAMIVLGLNAGQFPLTLTEKAVLNDRDRALLEANGVEVEPASQRAMLDERFLGYVALTRATEKLTLVRTRADAAGNELQPSPFWQLARHTLPGAPVEHPPEGVAAIATPRQAVTHLLHWARSATPMADVTAAALYHWVATKPTDAVRHVRDLAWPVLRHDNTPMLSAAVRKRLFPSPLAGSVSRLESFAACPFQHFVRYGLSLRQPPDPDITPADLGSLYHSVLEKLIQRVIDEEFDFASTDQLTPAQIGAVAQRVGEQLRNQLFLSSARNRYTLGRLEHIVARLLGAQQYACGRSAFKPGFTELQFGEGGDLPPLELDTPGGAKVRLSGKIDRVDLDDARQQYVVVDYKLRGEQLSLGYVAHGLMLQLLTYLMVLEINGEKLVGQKLTPAAAMYLKLLRTTTATKDPEAEPASTDPMFHGRSQARGIINAAYAEQLDRDIGDDTAPKLYSYRRTKKENKLYEAGNDGVELDEFQTLIAHVHGAIIELADGVIAGDIVPLPYMVGTDTPCGTCPYLSVCRFDRLINQYRILPRLSRREALDRIAGKGGFA
ncbi:MAG TPA: PD-(D/E)XK nuclease family protein, partial [Tepidisphaeraceae bacterium]